MKKPFEPGNTYGRNGLGGRPKGSRNKLCRALLADLLADWADGGADAIKMMRMEEPGAYIRVEMLRARALEARQEQPQLVEVKTISNGQH
jgi:hypothetical protein